MGLLSSFRKNKQETAPTGAYQTRAEDESDSVRRSLSRRNSAKERNKANDPVLPEKKRARRRLVGAVALVLAAVIGLPMILDSEPKPVADDIAIDIPSKDKREKAGQVPASPATPAPQSAAAKPPATAALDKDEEVIDPATLPAPGVPAPSTASKSEMPQLVKPEPKAEAKPEVRAETKASKAESKPDKHSDTQHPTKPEGAERKTELAHAKEAKAAHADKPDELARANAILEGRPEPKAEAKHDAEKKGGSHFVLQVAALATQDKVDELQGKLKSAGISSYTQKISTGSGSRTRVRVGPFGSKEEAERVRTKLGKLGLNGTLVPT